VYRVTYRLKSDKFNLRLISVLAKGAYLKSERETYSVSTKFLKGFKSTRFIKRLSYTHAPCCD